MIWSLNLRRIAGAHKMRRALTILAGALCAFAVCAPSAAQASAIQVDKTLCVSTGCGLTTVGPGQAVYYKITIGNSGPAATVDLHDPLPTGFVPVGGPNGVILCGPTVSTVAAISAPASVAGNVVVSNLTVPSTGLVCLIAGTFTAGSNNTATVFDHNSQVQLDWHSWSPVFNTSNPLPSDLSITKSASPASLNISQGPQTVTFTITVTNNGPADVYLGNLLTIQDTLQLLPQSVVLNATYGTATCAVTNSSNGPTTSNCLSPSNPVPPVSPPPSPLLVSSVPPSQPQSFVSWRYAPGSPGLLKVGDKMVLTVTATISVVPGHNCVIAPNSDGIVNHADITLTLPGSNTTITEVSNPSNPANAADNHANISVPVTTGATVIDAGCNGGGNSSDLDLQKIQLTPQPTNGFPWPSTVSYQLRIKNTSSTVIDSVAMTDLVKEGTETPPFSAAVVGFWDCGNNSPCPSYPNPPPSLSPCPLPVCGGTIIAAPSPQQLLGNGDIRQMLGTTVYPLNLNNLAPGHAEYFRIDLKYSNPQCDSFPNLQPKEIDNFERVTAWRKQLIGSAFTPPVTGLIQTSAATNMQAPPPCPMKVTKSTPATRVIFGTQITYTVTYQNLDPTNSHTMGTMIDTMRFTSGYATQMQVDYQYSCYLAAGTAVTGFYGGTSGFSSTNSTVHNPGWGVNTGNWDTASIVPTQLPQQGVRIIRNLTPVVFGPNSTVTCTVTVKVHQPASTDPYCSTVGSLENDAILDASDYYDPNTPWNTATPGSAMWASTHTPLPRCFNLAVNKSATPPWTWQGGGPLSWTLYVTNGGNAITTGGPVVTDTFTPNVTGAVSSSCTQPGSATLMPGLTPVPPGPPPVTGCSAYWNPAPTPSNPSKLHVTALDHLQGVDTQFSIPNAPPSVGPGGQICNSASAYIEPVVWNPKPNGKQSQQQEGQTQAYRPIPPPPIPDWFWQNPGTTSAQACIQVVQTAPLTIIKSVTNTSGLSLVPTFQVDVNCNLSPAIDGPHTTVAVSANSQTTVQHVPVGSTCTIQEQMPLPLPQPGPACANPAWSTEYLPGPTTVILASGATVTVHNTLFCNVGSLMIQKIATVPPGIQGPASVSVTVNCGPTPSVSVPVGGQYQINNIPVGSICTYSEITPSSPANCQWATTLTPPSPVTIPSAGSVTTVAINNALTCAGSVIINKISNVPPGTQNIPSVNVNVSCGGPPTIVTVPVGGQNQVNNIPANSVCTVTEQTPLPSLSGCQWSTSQSPTGPVTIPPSGAVQTVTITNTCTPTGGTLTVTKTFLNPPPAGIQLPTTVTCGTLVDSFMLGTGAASTHATSGIPSGTTSCTVNEIPPIGALGGCGAALEWVTWDPPIYVPGPTVTVPANGQQTVEVQNKSHCTPVTNSLLIQKYVSINGDPTPILPSTLPSLFQSSVFQVNVTCGSNPMVTVNLDASDGYESLLNALQQGSTCTIQEVQPSPPSWAPACTWTISYPQGTAAVISGGLTTLNVYNTQTCPPSPRPNPGKGNASPAMGTAVPQVDVSFDGPCATPPRKGRSDAQGRVLIAGLRPGKCRLFISPDALHNAAEHVGALSHSGLPFDIGIGIGGGSSGGNHSGGGKSENGEPVQSKQGGGSSFGGGGLSINIPLGQILSGNKPAGGAFTIVVQAGADQQQISIPCCDKASLSKGADIEFTVPANDNTAVVVTVQYVKAAKR